MFDYHMHSRVSVDSTAEPEEMLKTAVAKGLKEVCFTDHLDYDPLAAADKYVFDTEDYNATYDALDIPGLKIRKGMEFGMLPDNSDTMKKDLQRRSFDFVIGSVHVVDQLDIYFPPFWQDKTVDQAEQQYLEEMLACVQAHDGFDVLGHLTYISKVGANPLKRPVCYDRYRQIVDEIFKELIRKDKGIEVNTSGVAACGLVLPHDVYLRRFKELGGKIVTVGSDAHTAQRVGEHCDEVCDMLKEIFGYVCTFEKRQPIFHRL